MAVALPLCLRPSDLGPMRRGREAPGGAGSYSQHRDKGGWYETRTCALLLPLALWSGGKCVSAHSPLAAPVFVQLLV